jgi:uncharacterized membrane protein (UPF0136 family)
MLNIAAQISIVVFGTLVLGGGVMGFVKAKSKASLIAGVVSDALLLAAFAISFSNFRLGISVASFIAALLLLVFFLRLKSSKKFMPSGLMVLLSALESGFLYYVLHAS